MPSRHCHDGLAASIKAHTILEARLGGLRKDRDAESVPKALTGAPENSPMGTVTLCRWYSGGLARPYARQLQGLGAIQAPQHQPPQSNFWNVGAGARSPCAQCTRLRTLEPAAARKIGGRLSLKALCGSMAGSCMRQSDAERVEGRSGGRSLHR